MYRFWFREVMGWLLVAVGLGIFYVCFALLLARDPGIFEAPPLAVIGIVVFRGGIHLLKVSLAARIALQTPPEAPKAVVERAKKKSAPPLDW